MRRSRIARVPELAAEAGQATIEFALAMVLMMGVLLFFVQLALFMAYGSYVHYATFMAARAYLAAGADEDNQMTRARDTAVRLLKKGPAQPGIEKYPSIAKGEGGTGDVPGLTLGPASQYKARDRDFSWLQGVRYEFRGNLSSVPVLGPKNTVSLMTLVSESYLGKEPSYTSCSGYMANEVGGAIFDNGC